MESEWARGHAVMVRIQMLTAQSIHSRVDMLPYPGLSG